MAERTARREHRTARRGGFLVGLAVAILAVWHWQIPPGTGFPGTDVIVASGPTGELDISPPGPFVVANGLAPGPLRSADHGALQARNQTGRRLDVRLRAVPDGHDLDHVLWVEATAGPNRLYRGDLAGLRGWTATPWILDSGQLEPLTVRVWIPTTVRSGYQGRIESVNIEFHALPVAGS
jgi:hypothetical protein